MTFSSMSLYFADPTPDCPTTTQTSTTPGISTTSETLPCDQGQFYCGGNTCIPSFYICDGVPDCPNGNDETKSVFKTPIHLDIFDQHKITIFYSEICPSKLCEPDYYFCQNANLDVPCLGINFQCNGQIDCENGSDESVCGECPREYCLNEGTCTLSTNQVPVCQ